MEIKKVLLLQPLHEKLGGLAIKRTSIDFPYGMAYVARVLEDQAYLVRVLDAQALQLTKEEVIEEISKLNFDILGISAFCTQYNAVKKISNFVKKELQKPIIVGGPLATYSAELTLMTTPVEVCVINEGELTIVDLLKNFNNYKNVAGIAYKQGEKVVFTPPRPYIKNLDDLPRPAYHLFDMEKYLHMDYFAPNYDGTIQKKKEDEKQMSLCTTRGCPYRCKFCSRNFRGFRSMSMERRVKEVKFLKEKFGVKIIYFHDDLLFLNEAMVRKFVSLIKGLNIKWSSQARMNLVNYEMLKMMKESGCVGLGFGIESGSQKILDNMNKMITVEQIERVMLWCKKLDLPMKVQLIFGYPGEDDSTLQETINLFKKIDHPGRKFNFITPYPGSELYKEAIAQGKIRDEAEYLTSIEKSTGRHRNFINFTEFPDEELYSIMKKTEKTILNNYYKRHPDKFLINFLRRFKKRPDKLLINQVIKVMRIINKIKKSKI